MQVLRMTSVSKTPVSNITNIEYHNLTIPIPAIQMFKWHLNSRPFNDQTMSHDLNTGLVIFISPFDYFLLMITVKMKKILSFKR